ncbi:MAG: helix-turn-helix domain-containing protein [Emcibacter sp.]|nr:helix-turn-helix domain-containing protein [Emcibacter sp.]
MEKRSHPDPVDIHVGARLRLRRTLLGLTQDQLGKALNLTFQQVQKYERGANRIGSSRLYKLSQILDVPVSFFFDEMPDDMSQPSAGIVNNKKREDIDHFSRRETLVLVKNYYNIEDMNVRKKLYYFIKTLAR